MSSKGNTKAFLDRVKQNQLKKLGEPNVVREIKVTAYDNGQITVSRPEGNDPESIAANISLLAAGINMQAQVLVQAQDSRIQVAPPGLKVS